MKRSEINRLLSGARAFFSAHGFHLPPWATWSAAKWEESPDMARWCKDHQIGWDISDFGADDFAKRGLVLFCIRNGRIGIAGEKTYAEKIMMVREDQETPFHYHAQKMEDIIVRGGGNLVIEMFNIDARGQRTDDDVTVRTDGQARQVKPCKPLTLKPGESITLAPRVFHRFYGEKGHGTVLVGEVSSINDDLSDNYFFESGTRFSRIEEDAPPIHLLWNELPF
ncbi:MAG: D-lyxose/D-mannose family sugar isomerase [Rhodospirillales bacterium]|nr:D-lyxose/D-mannose family sugar isomerase [Rhodospirillales bacterium]